MPSIAGTLFLEKHKHKAFKNVQVTFYQLSQKEHCFSSPAYSA